MVSRTVFEVHLTLQLIYPYAQPTHIPTPEHLHTHLSDLHVPASHGPCISHAGLRKRQGGLTEAIKSVAWRILSSPKDDFTPSPLPRQYVSSTRS